MNRHLLFFKGNEDESRHDLYPSGFVVHAPSEGDLSVLPSHWPGHNKIS